MYGLFSIRKHANDDLVEIVIKDSDSGRKSIVTLEVSLEKFARAAFGQAEVECEITRRNLEKCLTK